jgi:hypothetical protein
MSYYNNMKCNRSRENTHALGRARGLTTFEIVMATVVLGVAMMLTVRCLGWVVRERRSIDRRAIAVQEAANLMERLTAQSWKDLTPETFGDQTLSEEAIRSLPGAELKVAVADRPGELLLKRIRVQLRWRGRSGGYEAPVRLTAWVSRRGGAEP